ncbi:hypothetical protein AWN90_18980 [Nocardia terpenica]|uniref:AbrB/MazE/SpoVT family DNA-binding domain-containing protein n=2 Tax=Nocardia terpenica TaxID=455432 RepID=A0A164PEL4_9NOCA|nr:hypothetical protein AWN90_18980 [Nocardia terpenica]
MPELMIGTGAMNRFEYSVAVICCHGQVGDRAAVKRLGWLPEQPISLTVAGRTAVAFEHSDGGFRVDHDGHLRLPAVIRHRCGIEPGDRLLIAASVPGRLLLIYPLVVIDQALSTLHEQATSTVR